MPSGFAPASNSAFSMARLSPWTAQCTAVEPSGAAWFGSAPPLSSERTALRLPFLAASTRAVPSAANDAVAHNRASVTPMDRKTAMCSASRACRARTLVVEQQLPGAVAQLRDRHTHVIEHGHEQVGHRRVRCVVEAVAGLELAVQLARQQDGQVLVTMKVSVAHAAAKQNRAVVEQRAVAVRRVAHPLQEVVEETHVMRVDPRLLRFERGVLTMMGNQVMVARHSDLAVRTPAQVARHD